MENQDFFRKLGGLVQWQRHYFSISKCFSWFLTKSKKQNTGTGEGSKPIWIKWIAKAGLLDVFLNEEPSPKTTFDRLFNREKETFIENAFKSMGNMSKLQTFRFLKNDWKIEDYLLTVKNISDRISLTKFILSDHSLLMEKGRH